MPIPHSRVGWDDDVHDRCKRVCVSVVHEAYLEADAVLSPYQRMQVLRHDPISLVARRRRVDRVDVDAEGGSATHLLSDQVEFLASYRGDLGSALCRLIGGLRRSGRSVCRALRIAGTHECNDESDGGQKRAADLRPAPNMVE